jgi:hypothetical protein
MIRIPRSVLLTSLTLVAIVLVGVRAPEAGEPRKVQKMDFKPGQMWQYRTRPQEPKSRVLIQRVERNDKFGEVVHIRVVGLAFKGPKGNVSVLPHLPFSGAGLRGCLTVLESSDNEVPADYLAGYKVWREAFDAGKGGVFTGDLAAVLDAMEKGTSK